MIRVWIEESFIKRRISKRLLHFDSDWKADISNLNVSSLTNGKNTTKAKKSQNRKAVSDCEDYYTNLRVHFVIDECVNLP